MYGKLKYEQQPGDSEVPSLLSWRFNDQGGDNVTPIDQRHPALLQGTRFEDDRPTVHNRLPENTERRYEEISPGENLSWRKPELGGRYEDTTAATLNHHHPSTPGANGIRHEEPPRPKHNLVPSPLNETSGPGGLSWRERLPGAPNVHPVEPPPPRPISHAEEADGLSWRSSRPPLGANNARPAEPVPLMSPRDLNSPRRSEPRPRSPEERYRDEPAGLSWRSSQPQPGPQNVRPSDPTLTLAPPHRNANGNNRPSDLSPLIPHKELITTRLSEPPPSRLPPPDERCNGIRRDELSWRSSQHPPDATTCRTAHPPSLISLRESNNSRAAEPLPSTDHRVPRVPRADDRYNRDVRETDTLSWRSAQTALGSTDVRPASPRIPHPEDRCRDEPVALTYRSSQPPLGAHTGRPSEPSTRMSPREDRYRDEIAGPVRHSEPSPLMSRRDDRHNDIHEADRLSWRASQHPPGTNDIRSSEPPPRIPPADDRYKDIHEAGGLSWRSPQPPPGTNTTRPSEAAPLMPLRGSTDRRVGDSPPRIPLPDDRHPERHKDVHEPDGLSWRSSQPPLGSNNTRPSEPIPLIPQRDINDTRPRRLPDTDDHRLAERNRPSSLNWCTLQAAIGTVRHCEEPPLVRAQEERPTALSWRTLQTGSSTSNNNSRLLEPAPLIHSLKGSNNSRIPDPVPLLGSAENRLNDVKEPAAVLSWRSTPTGGPNHNAPSEGRGTAPERRVDDIGVGELSWRSGNSGGDILGKRRYSDRYPDEPSSRLPSRDPYGERGPPHPPKALY